MPDTLILDRNCSAGLSYEVHGLCSQTNAETVVCLKHCVGGK